MNKKKKSLSLPRLAAWTVRFMWSVSRLDVIGLCVSMAVQVAAEITQLWVAAMVIAQIGALVTKTGSGDQLVLLAMLSLGLMVIDKIAWQMLSLCERRLYLSGSGKIYALFNEKMAYLSVEQHNNPVIRQMIDRLSYEGYAWKPLNFSFEVFYSGHALLRFVIASAAIVTAMPLVVVLLVIAALPMVFVQRKAGDAGWGIWGDIGDGSRIFWGISELLKKKSSLEEIIPQQSEKYLLGRANAAIQSYVKRATRVRNKYATYEVGAGIFEMFIAGACYMWLIVKTAAGSFGLQQFVFLSSLIWQTLSSVRLVSTSVGRALEIVPFMQDFVAFNNLPDRRDTSTGKQKVTAPLTIVFDDVSFRYPGKNNSQLEHISLTIKPGDHIALVGENGAGKTTLIRLLLGFYEPTKGAVTVNGISLKDIDITSYYAQIGTLFQAFNQYPLDFKANVTLSSRSNEQRYAESLNIAGADHVLKRIDSESTMLSPEFTNGTDLSGGQWQRVALARNLYNAGSIYILDEPTSAIDALAEADIFNKLYKELTDKTLITVSHRFNTVRKADTIVVLEKGRVVEQGSHASLMKQKGSLYSAMFKAQAEGYGD